MYERKQILSSKRIGLIHRGESYAIEEIDGNWVLISIGNNKQGWVYSFHGILSSQSKKASDEPDYRDGDYTFKWDEYP